MAFCRHVRFGMADSLIWIDKPPRSIILRFDRPRHYCYVWVSPISDALFAADEQTNQSDIAK